jgi:hypothetical protein
MSNNTERIIDFRLLVLHGRADSTFWPAGCAQSNGKSSKGSELTKYVPVLDEALERSAIIGGGYSSQIRSRFHSSQIRTQTRNSSNY